MAGDANGTQDTNGQQTQQTEADGQQQTTQTQVEGQTQRTAADTNAGTPDPRTDGILRDLQTERQKRQALEQKLDQLSQGSETQKRRLAEALGVVDPAEDENEKQVKAAFAKLFPGLAKLAEKVDPDKLMELVEHAGQLQETTNDYWTRHAETMLVKVEDAITKELGGSGMSDRQRSYLRRAYLDECQASVNAREANGYDGSKPDFFDRHQKGDAKLVEEFAKNWIDDWFEPARRKVTQQQTGRLGRRVPSGGRTESVMTQQRKPIDFKNDDAFANALVDAVKEGGGGFGR